MVGSVQKYVNIGGRGGLITCPAEQLFLHDYFLSNTYTFLLPSLSYSGIASEQ